MSNVPICMTEEYWASSPLSVARYYGRIKFNGHEYYIVDKLGRDLWECTAIANRIGQDKAIPAGEPADLVRRDFIPYYRKLGRNKFLEVLKEHPTHSDKLLLGIYKEITSKPKKDVIKPIDIFGEYNAPSDKYCRTCKHRKRYELNEHSNRIVQCCELRPSSRSNSGYHTIKTTDKACNMYEEESK